MICGITEGKKGDDDDMEKQGMFSAGNVGSFGRKEEKAWV